jgi:carbon monoxide dehydrogenase subunit G
VQLEHSFTVPVGIDEAWRVLLDIERIAPCMPGAAIDSVDGDDFTGTVKVKLGPIGLTYKGKASFVEKDEAAHRAVIDARGRDARGNGTAAAKITANLAESGTGTQVTVVTELDITGKPAQFGRGVMVDVGNKLIGQFADCLAGQLGGGAPPPPTPAKKAPAKKAAAKKAAAPAAKTAPAGTAAERADAHERADAAEHTTASAAEPVETAPARNAPTMAEPAAAAPARPVAEPEPINLLESAGPAVAKRLAPVALVLLVLLIIVRRRRSR